MRRIAKRRMRWNEIFAIVSIIIVLALVVVFAVEVVCLYFQPPAWEPTEVYPMANANISWEQTYFPGNWSDGA